MKRPVHLHAIHQSLGGAARIAQTLGQGLATRGLTVHRTFEIQDEPGAESSLCAPRELAQRLRPDQLLHLHASQDLPGLLETLSGDQPLILTLHDCRPLTGGCVYPLQCEGWRSGCPEPCPRDYAGCQEMAARTRAAIRRCRPLLVAPSAWMAAMTQEIFPELTVRQVPNGVELPELLDKKQARQALGIHESARLTVFAAHGGEAAVYKSGDRWLALWHKIKALEPRAVAMFMGGTEISRDADLFRWPYLPPERLSRFLAAADVLVYPTLADNHSLVVLEAMAADTAVAAFDVGGIPEQIKDRVNGRLLAPGDWQGLAQAAAELLADPRQAADLGRKGRALVEQRFTTRHMLDRHLKVYSELSS